eukprot:TRINITY_DN28502_c0_g1_i1.p2 TRINITY_DN28502_c0_g1~~TRINITY_DN28502_c0_g1_i1.p2  ORF type:complete len:251 (+),score=61.58 TRINITY_DN28502_c0_g1_i1:53-805(+)
MLIRYSPKTVQRQLVRSSIWFFFFFKQKTAYEMLRSLVGSEMCIRDSLNGIPSTVIDPRPTALAKFVTKFEYGIYSRNPALAKWNKTASQHKVAWLPQHMRLFFDDALFDHVRGGEDAETLGGWLEGAFETAEATCWTSKGLTPHEDGFEDTCCCEPTAPEEDEDAAEEQLDVPLVVAPLHVREVLLGCSCVAGMHPDQAAEPIVDWALGTGKPFAVVPCCVYSKEFPHRRLADGREVKSYNDLIDYLMV